MELDSFAFITARFMLLGTGLAACGVHAILTRLETVELRRHNPTTRQDHRSQGQRRPDRRNEQAQLKHFLTQG